ncbi:MAG: hypothetical protein IKM02_04930 [Clostridia bacterium]|nr:hypothetical protein [Clostridia bacterium]
MNINLQFKFLAIAVILAIIALWLEGCSFSIVESTPVHITRAGAALAEEAEGFIGRGSLDAEEDMKINGVFPKDTIYHENRL